MSIVIFIGGVCGSLLRFSLSFIVMGTLISNFIGSFGLGIFLSFLSKKKLSEYIKLGISVGFFGSLTTFSTFNKETILFIQNDQPFLALQYITATLAGGILLAWIGSKVGEWILMFKKETV